MIQHAALIIADNREATLFEDLAQVQSIGVSRYTDIEQFTRDIGTSSKAERAELVVVDLQRRGDNAVPAPDDVRGGLDALVPFVALVDSPEKEAVALSVGYERCLQMPFTLARICEVFEPYIDLSSGRCTPQIGRNGQPADPQTQTPR